MTGLGSESDSSGEWDFSSTGRPFLSRTESSQQSVGSNGSDHINSDHINSTAGLISSRSSISAMPERQNSTRTIRAPQLGALEFAQFGMAISASVDSSETSQNLPTSFSLSPSHAIDNHTQPIIRGIPRSRSVNAVETNGETTQRMVRRSDGHEDTYRTSLSSETRSRGVPKINSESSGKDSNQSSPSNSTRPQIRRQKSVQISDVPSLNLKFFQGDNSNLTSKAPPSRGFGRMKSMSAVGSSFGRATTVDSSSGRGSGFRLDGTMRSTDSSSSTERPRLLRSFQSERQVRGGAAESSKDPRRDLEQQQAVAALSEASDSDEEANVARRRAQQHQQSQQLQQIREPHNNNLPPLPFNGVGKLKRTTSTPLSRSLSGSGSFLSNDEYDLPVLTGDPLQPSFDVADDHLAAPKLLDGEAMFTLPSPLIVTSPTTADQLGMRRGGGSGGVYAASPTAIGSSSLVQDSGPFASVLHVLKATKIASTDISDNEKDEYSPLFSNIIKPTLQHVRNQMQAQFEDLTRELLQRRQQHTILKAKIEQSGSAPNPRALKMLGSFEAIEKEEVDLAQQKKITSDIITALIASLTALDIASNGELTREFVDSFSENLDADIADYVDSDDVTPEDS